MCGGFLSGVQAFDPFSDLLLSSLLLIIFWCTSFSHKNSSPRCLGVSADRVPASRWRRQVVRFDEYSPSRRRSAPRLPGTVQASASLRIRSLSAAVKRRLAALAGTSGSGGAAGATRSGSAVRGVSSHGRAGARRATAMPWLAVIGSGLIEFSPPRPLL